MKISQWNTRFVIDIWKLVIKLPHFFQWKKKFLEWIEANKNEFSNYKEYKHTELLAETKYSLCGVLNIQEKIKIFDAYMKIGSYLCKDDLSWAYREKDRSPVPNTRIWNYLRKHIKDIYENISPFFIHEVMCSYNYGIDKDGKIKLVDYWKNLRDNFPVFPIQ